MQLLEAAGFQATADCMQLAADAPLGPLRAALARLRRLADNKGHSGEAEFFPLPSKAASAGGSRPSGASPFLVSTAPCLCGKLSHIYCMPSESGVMGARTCINPLHACNIAGHARIPASAGDLPLQRV